MRDYLQSQTTRPNSPTSPNSENKQFGSGNNPFLKNHNQQLQNSNQSTSQSPFNHQFDSKNQSNPLYGTQNYFPNSISNATNINLNINSFKAVKSKNPKIIELCKCIAAAEQYSDLSK
jgi:aspartyl/asparaginyl beta-hydroxylase (cupin superfamily)